MTFWLNQEKTISLEGLKSSSSSEKDTISTKSIESFILEPDIVLGNVGRTFYPDDEIATNFLSLMAGYIMKSMESKDSERKIYRKNLMIRASETLKNETDQVNSMLSVQLEKCAHKKSKKKLRGSRIYRSFSSRSSIVSSLQKKRLSQKSTSISSNKADKEAKPPPSEIEEMGEEEQEEEEVKLTEDELIAQLLAGCPPKSYLSAHYMERKLHNWTFKERDQDVEITFKNGDRYYGRLSRMLMEGDGKYIWSNGMIYKGSFKEGNAHGSGSILWPDGSWYEGEMACNNRHGHGLTHKMTPYGEMYHYGLYRFGKKHGQGVLVFGKNNWYDGEWKFGKRDGFGTRYYASGAIYCGEWVNGMRSGHGTMIWPNNDVYTGSWKMGFMHGTGKYTWGAFRNTRFVAPQHNVFTGRFFDGKRLGFGHLQLASGASIYTTWCNRQKTGNGEIICRNGNKLFARNLFYEDRAVEVDLSGIVHDFDLPDTNEDDIELLNLMDDSELRKRVKPRIVNVNSPVHKMDFTRHINKLFEIDYNLCIPPSPDDPECKVERGQCEAIRELEAAWLEKIIMQRMADLTAVYTFYATIGIHNELPDFKIVMLRIMLYQLLRDCGIKETKYSAVEFDQMVGIGCDPFDKVLMYEMIHYLMTLCMLTRMNPRCLNTKIPGVLAATFDRFIDEVVLKSLERYNGTFLKFLKCMPLQAVYKLFLTFERPLTIKILCHKLFNPYNTFSDRMPFTTEYFLYALQGNNTVFADGSFGYVPYEEPFVDFKKESLKFEKITQADFGIFADIGFENIIRSISEVVPEAMSPHDGELDGNYMLSFLDFCDILVNFATQYLDLCDEYYKALMLEDESSPLEKNESDLKKSAAIKARTSKAVSRKSIKNAERLSQSKFGKGDGPNSDLADALKASLKNSMSSNPWLPKKFVVEDLESLNE